MNSYGPWLIHAYSHHVSPIPTEKIGRPKGDCADGHRLGVRRVQHAESHHRAAGGIPAVQEHRSFRRYRLKGGARC